MLGRRSAGRQAEQAEQAEHSTAQQGRAGSLAGLLPGPVPRGWLPHHAAHGKEHFGGSRSQPISPPVLIVIVVVIVTLDQHTVISLKLHVNVQDLKEGLQVWQAEHGVEARQCAAALLPPGGPPGRSACMPGCWLCS